MPLILAAALLGVLGASINYLASRWAPSAIGRLILVLSIVPMIGILIFCAVVLGLAIQTTDMRYFGADTVFSLVLIATFIWVPSVYLGARAGRSSRLS
jgi:hypothetical protein